MKNKKSNSNSLELNHNQDYYLMKKYNDNQIDTETYNMDFADKDINIDYEKDEYFDNLQNKNKYSILNKRN